MAVNRISNIERFIGLYADTKPTGVPVGSRFYAYDAYVDYITYDGTNWEIFQELTTHVYVSKTLVQGAEPISVNLFSFTGPFRMHRLYGVCVEATDASDCDDAFFNLYDGTNVVDMSDDQSGSGITLSGITVGSVFGLNAAPTVDAFYQKSDQCRYLDATYAGSEIWQRGLIIAKAGVTNYIRFTYDSAADSGLDLDIDFHLVYEELCPEAIPSALVAV